MIKNPFILLNNAIPKEACNDIIASLNNNLANYVNGEPVLTLKFNKLEELRLQPLIDDLLDYAEPYYGFETQNISTYQFEWYPEGYKMKPMSSDSYKFVEGRWRKTREIDFTILLFLSSVAGKDFSNPEIEHFGGGLQFPTHNFTLHPNAGDLLMFPSDNHFLNTFGEVKLGNLNVVRIMITAKQNYKYDKKQFPGNFKKWFL